ncbi:GID complex subunit containing RING finger motif [Allomyces javanicus]|nr:GID complex subunit containing RING finger motif [Allomyces javanicus]
MADKIKLNVDGILALESSFIKVPYEQLKKANRKAQKFTEKELTNLASGVADLAKGKGSGAKDPVKALDAMIERMNKLKRKLDELKAEETMYAGKLAARLSHLQDLAHIRTLTAPEFAAWAHLRLQRVLLDYLMRHGFLTSAKLLATGSSSHPASDASGSVLNLAAASAAAEPMTVDTDPAPASASQAPAPHPVTELVQFADLEFFTHQRRIERALERHSCTEALAWCHDNKVALKKLKSHLEFNLRLQEFIELARTRQLVPALEYAKTHLVAFADLGHTRAIQQAMALLAFPPTTTCEPYRTLYDSDRRWTALAAQFRADNFALHCLPPLSALEATLQAGLAALKTAQCGGKHEDRSINCPVCVPDTFAVLAEKLPLGHHVNSCYVCRISGEIMDGDNPPLVTPEGYVYSRKAVHEMAAKNNGFFRCPRTHSIFKVAQMKKMFLT